MNRSHFALFVAILIHLLLLLFFWFLGTITPEIEKGQKPKENKIKVSLKEVTKKIDKVGETKETVKKEPLMAPPMPKGSQLKEIVNPAKKPPIKYEAKDEAPTHLNRVQKEEPKRERAPKTEPLPLTKPYIPLISEEEEKKKDPMGFLYEDKSAEEAKEKSVKQTAGSSIGNTDLKELYGDEFGKLTSGQQKYLIDNQEIMRRITQEILNRIARVNLRHDMNVNRVNIVEFYLHPNGDMTNFKFLQSSGYQILDQTTQETIEFAYSRYPRPNEKILIRYNVFYNLAR
ncbi:energy transducer TonB [Sulfurimonas sp.]|uniref:energy transducer TonB family protein n=1 Tax=Sulfurimonas sp. TaxID=2022749 RepID=UPI0025CE6794|nr:energy transducer TonB [Sulfurimonas sp.]MBW6487632.1 TonB family protein [Sulfurimonas sp.]